MAPRNSSIARARRQNGCSVTDKCRTNHVKSFFICAWSPPKTPTIPYIILNQRRSRLAESGKIIVDELNDIQPRGITSGCEHIRNTNYRYPNGGWCIPGMQHTQGICKRRPVLRKVYCNVCSFLLSFPSRKVAHQ